MKLIVVDYLKTLGLGGWESDLITDDSRMWPLAYVDDDFPVDRVLDVIRSIELPEGFAIFDIPLDEMRHRELDKFTYLITRHYSADCPCEVDAVVSALYRTAMALTPSTPLRKTWEETPKEVPHTRKSVKRSKGDNVEWSKWISEATDATVAKQSKPRATAKVGTSNAASLPAEVMTSLLPIRDICKLLGVPEAKKKAAVKAVDRAVIDGEIPLPQLKENVGPREASKLYRPRDVQEVLTRYAVK